MEDIIRIDEDTVKVIEQKERIIKLNYLRKNKEDIINTLNGIKLIEIPDNIGDDIYNILNEKNIELEYEIEELQMQLSKINKELGLYDNSN